MSNFDNLDESLLGGGRVRVAFQERVVALYKAAKKLGGSTVYEPSYMAKPELGQFRLMFENVPVKDATPHGLSVAYVKHALRLLSVLDVPITTKPTHVSVEDGYGKIEFRFNRPDGLELVVAGSMRHTEENTFAASYLISLRSNSNKKIPLERLPKEKSITRGRKMNESEEVIDTLVEDIINEATGKIQDKTNSLFKAIKLVRGCEVDLNPNFNKSRTASYGQFAVSFYNIPIKGQGDHVHSLLTSFVKHALSILNVMGIPMTLKPTYNKYESNQGHLTYEWTDSDGYKIEVEASIVEIDTDTPKPQNIVHYAVWVINENAAKNKPLKKLTTKSTPFTKKVDANKAVSKKAKTANYVFPEITVGTIFHSSWGYNMTHADFYQVVDRTASFVKVRKLAVKQDGNAWQGYATPMRDTFDGGIIRAKLGNTGSSAYISIDRSQTAFLWDGKPKYYNFMD